MRIAAGQQVHARPFLVYEYFSPSTGPNSTSTYWASSSQASASASFYSYSYSFYSYSFCCYAVLSLLLSP